MSKTLFLSMVAAGIIFWIGATAVALRKHKMFAIAIFFTVPCGLVFGWLMLYILLLLLGYNPLKEEHKAPVVVKETEEATIP